MVSSTTATGGGGSKMQVSAMTRGRAKPGAELAAEETYDFLLRVPAWVGPVLAVVVFVGMRFVVPAILRSDSEAPIGLVFATVASTLAPFVGVGIIVLWVFAEIRKRSRRKLLASQSDLESIRQLSWLEFEHLVGEAFRQSGCVVEERGGSGGDGGIDLVLTKDGDRTLVQCKQWKTRKVGVKPVRELYGVLISEKASRALLVTCGSFTREAIEFAECKPLELIDGPELCSLVGALKQAPVSTREPATAGNEGHAKPSPDVLGTRGTPESPHVCPKCGSPMVERVAKKGAKAGEQFWGCSRFPTCRGTRNRESLELRSANGQAESSEDT